MLRAVLRIRIRLDPFHFGQSDPDPLLETDQGSKNSANIMEKFQPNQQKSNQKQRISSFLKTYTKLMFNGHKYLPHK